MAEASADKPAKLNKPIEDVSRPGKTAPASTSKPVIITNRPVIKDPMVVEDQAEAPADEATPIKVSRPAGGIVLKPLSAPELPVEKKVAAKAETDEAPVAPAEPSTPEPALTETAAAPSPETASSSVDEPSPASDKPAELTPAADTLAATEPPADETTDSKSATETPAATDSLVEPEKGDDQTSPVDAKLKEEAAAAEAKAKRDAELEKLVEDKTYYLPVNAVEKRRTKRVVIAGILLSLLLAAAWVDIALDAGLIKINGLKAITHFFSS